MMSEFGGEGEVVDDTRRRWSCKSCTLINPPDRTTCDACGRTRRHHGNVGGSDELAGGRGSDRGGLFASPPPGASAVIDLISGGSMETARNKKRKRQRQSSGDGMATGTAGSSGDARRGRGDRDPGGGAVIDVDDDDVSEGVVAVVGGGSRGGRCGSSKSKSKSGKSKSTSSKSRFFGIFAGRKAGLGCGDRGDPSTARRGFDDDMVRGHDGYEPTSRTANATETTRLGSRKKNGRRPDDDDDGGIPPNPDGAGADGTSIPPSSSSSSSSDPRRKGQRRRRTDDDGRFAESHNRRNCEDDREEAGRRRRKRGIENDESSSSSSSVVMAHHRGTEWHHRQSDLDHDHDRRRRPPSANDDAGCAANSNPSLHQPPRPNLTIPYETLLAKSQSILRHTFKIPSLRNLQPTAVSNALRGKSQIIVMATGAGKSLCYQLPAATLPGLAIVVSPLIALMQDQVRGLNGKGIRAALVCSANGARENERILGSLRRRATADGEKGADDHGGGRSTAKNTALAANAVDAKGDEIKLLYCTPELIDTSRFRSILSTLHSRSLISLVAIDEAHCLSTWGHDFRPAYRKLSSLAGLMEGVPVMACTATATPNVIRDIRDCLGLTEGEVPLYKSSFNRENISYEVRFKDSLDVLSPRGAIGDLIDVIKKQHSSTSAVTGSDGAGPRGGGAAATATAVEAFVEPCSGIVYVHKRADTSKLAHQITKATGIKAAAYHAGLSDASRKQTQQQWTNGTIQVAVATVAFGMGIDLPHVRYVIHWTIAKSVEGFYQESGRGGRDGKPALSILYYSKEDASKFSFLIKKTMESKRLKRQREGHANQSRDKVSQEQDDRSFDALQKMCDYCTKPCCKRQYLLKHFGETIDTAVCNKTCDYCRDPTKVEEAIRSSDVVKQVAKQASSYRSAGFGKAQGATQKEWDGQWDRPHGSEGDDDDVGDNSGDWDDFDDDGLTVDGSRKGSDGIDRGALKSSRAGVASAASGGFVKAKDVLAKYEMMECQEGKTNGFVNFRNKKSDAPPVVPSHLRSKNMPDPLSLSSNSQKQKACLVGENTDGKSSAEIGCEVERLKAELAQLKAKRATRLANHAGDDSSKCDAATSLGCKARKVVVPAPPPPPISFRPNTSRKKRK